MSFAQEMKDFYSGFKATYSVAADIRDAKAKKDSTFNFGKAREEQPGMYGPGVTSKKSTKATYAEPEGDVKKVIDDNVPEGMREFAYKMAFHESKYDPSAVSPTGATGLFQFTKGTGSQYGLVGENGDMRSDPALNAQAFVKLTEANRTGLAKALGREPSYGELALAHQQGLGGATYLLTGKGSPKVVASIESNLAHNNIKSKGRDAAAQIASFYGFDIEGEGLPEGITSSGNQYTQWTPDDYSSDEATVVPASDEDGYQDDSGDQASAEDMLSGSRNAAIDVDYSMPEGARLYASGDLTQAPAPVMYSADGGAVPWSNESSYLRRVKSKPSKYRPAQNTAALEDLPDVADGGKVPKKPNPNNKNNNKNKNKNKNKNNNKDPKATGTWTSGTGGGDGPPPSFGSNVVYHAPVDRSYPTGNISKTPFRPGGNADRNGSSNMAAVGPNLSAANKKKMAAKVAARKAAKSTSVAATTEPVSVASAPKSTAAKPATAAKAKLSALPVPGNPTKSVVSTPAATKPAPIAAAPKPAPKPSPKPAPVAAKPAPVAAAPKPAPVAAAPKPKLSALPVPGNPTKSVVSTPAAVKPAPVVAAPRPAPVAVAPKPAALPVVAPAPAPVAAAPMPAPVAVAPKLMPAPVVAAKPAPKPAAKPKLAALPLTGNSTKNGFSTKSTGAIRMFAEGGLVDETEDQEVVPAAAPAPRPAMAIPPEGVTSAGNPRGSGREDLAMEQRQTQRSKQASTSNAIDAGLKYLTKSLGLDRSNTAVGDDPQLTDGRRKLVNGAVAPGEGPPTQQEVEGMYKVVDPNNELSEGLKTVYAMKKGYEFYMERGQPEKAAKFAAGVIQYSNLMSKQFGVAAVEAAKGGDQDGMVKYAIKAYDAIPDGLSVDAKPVEGGMQVTRTDEDGEVVDQNLLTPQQIFQMATGISHGSGYFEALMDVAGEGDKPLTALQKRRLALEERRVKLGEAEITRKEAAAGKPKAPTAAEQRIIEGNKAGVSFYTTLYPTIEDSLSPEQKKAWDAASASGSPKLLKEMYDDVVRRQDKETQKQQKLDEISVLKGLLPDYEADLTPAQESTLNKAFETGNVNAINRVFASVDRDRANARGDDKRDGTKEEKAAQEAADLEIYSARYDDLSPNMSEGQKRAWRLAVEKKRPAALLNIINEVTRAYGVEPAEEGDPPPPLPTSAIDPGTSQSNAGKPMTPEVLSKAKAAIAAGKSRAGVIAKLKSMGFSTEGL